MELRFFWANPNAVDVPAIPPPMMRVSVFSVFSLIQSGNVLPTGSPSRPGVTSPRTSAILCALRSARSDMRWAFTLLRLRIQPYMRLGSTVWYRSMSHHSTESARMAPALLMLSGTCDTPLEAKISFASWLAKGELVAPAQYRMLSGKFLATSSVMASELAQGTKKLAGVEVQSSIGWHPSILALSGNRSQVWTRLAPRRTSSLATVDPTLPHP
mmetsp:Transcript_1797/g.3956  ORF Transcript_1797/g.3956 Transcript_1797/m.3956 type:complete len:214 (-) Transcript_1797:182-823(-)